MKERETKIIPHFPSYFQTKLLCHTHFFAFDMAKRIIKRRLLSKKISIRHFPSLVSLYIIYRYSDQIKREDIDDFGENSDVKMCDICC